jgi:hypothetical protein
MVNQTGKDTTIAGFALPQLFATGEGATMGPFSTAGDALQAIIHAQLRLSATGEVSGLPLDNYLADQWKLEAIPQLCAAVVPDDAGPRFYLKHNDDKGDHLLVDEDYRITAIIGWEYASTEVKDLAFTSPCMMWPVGDVYDSKNNLSPEELEFAGIFCKRGRHDMAKLILKGRKWQRFLFSLSENMPSGLNEFQALFQGLRAAMMDYKDTHKLEPYTEWKRKAIAKFVKTDVHLQKLLKDFQASS